MYFFKTWFEMFLLFDHITFKILFKSTYNSSCITEICFTTKVKYFHGYSVAQFVLFFAGPPEVNESFLIQCKLFL